MKFIVTLVVAIAAVTTTISAGVLKKDYVPVAVKFMEKLYKGPPEVLPTRSTSRVETKWITQKLDHFDTENNKTWQMRYMVNEEHFEDGGPMFIYLGGEWSISPSRIAGGIWYDLAQKHKGILFYTEHRYYGESKPTRDISVENIKYLHVKQALADLAYFIRNQRETNPRLAKSKVIISGGSYSATMTVWFSKLYPELVNGGWASSAPILAQVDFKAYKEVVGKALQELGSPACYKRVENGIADLEAMFNDKRSAEAKALLQVCNSFDHNNDFDLWSLFDTISNIFAGVVQYQKEGDIPKLCDDLLSFEDDVTAISTYFLKVVSSGRGCVDVTYKSTLDYYSDASYKYQMSRPWFYQTCNEYGWYQSSTSKEQPFGHNFPSTLYITLCYDVFGAQYTNERIHKLVAATNNVFGGMNPQVKNVYMTHGAFDPWSAMGHNETQGATVIPRAAHCADFGSISSSDSAEMRASKERLFTLVNEWLA